MRGALAEVFRKTVLVHLKHICGNITEPGIDELTIVHPGIGQQTVGRSLALILTQIIGGRCQAPLQSAEQHSDLKRLHSRIQRNQLIAVILAIHVKQVILPTQNLTGLIQLTAVDADILVLGSLRHHDCFPIA